MYGDSTKNKPSPYGTCLTFGGAIEGSAFRNQLAIGTNTTIWMRVNINNGGLGNWIELTENTTYSTVTTGYSYTPMNRLYRNGKNRTLSFALRSDIPINNESYNIVANISDKNDCPISEIRSSCIITKVADGSILGVGEVKIDTSGNVSVKSSVGENYNEIYMNISWITQ